MNIEVDNKPYRSNDIGVKFFSGRNFPAEIVELRRKGFVEERGFLPDAKLLGPNDEFGTHIGIYDGAGVLLAATHVMLADESDFSEYSGIPPEFLRDAILSSRSVVASHARNRGIVSLLLYVAMRWGRMHGRRHGVGYVEQGESAAQRILGCKEIPGCPKRKVQGADGEFYDVIATYGPLDYLAQRCFLSMTRTLRNFVCRELMADEIIAAAKRGIKSAYDNLWFKRVADGTLTRNQYGEAIANLHQYVRWTTRLLAQVISATSDPVLRGHFIEHLKGEIDHERLLERDLTAIGWDVDWVINHMAPAADILQFMTLQQSLVSFERDPVLFLTVPLVAEGLSAFMDPTFIDALETCVEGWGIAHPRSATKFIRSHVGTDGGEDGHWASVQHVLVHSLSNEAQLQKCLALVQSISEAMNRAYSGYVSSQDLGAIRFM